MRSAIIPPEEVKKTLEAFELRKESFEELELHEAIRKAFEPATQTPQEVKDGWYAELTAFHFFESPVEEFSVWGTHFGPIFTAENSNGDILVLPDIKDLDAEIIKYWEIRATETSHPVLKARYADLVWDLSEKITSEKREIKYAHLAIDQYILSSQIVNENTRMQARRHLERALELSISINDNGRIESVKKAMFNLFDKIATPSEAGTWPFLFDSLYQNKKVSLSEDEKNKIIASLEDILKKTSDPAIKDQFNPWAAQSAAERLEIYYRKNEKLEQAKRAILQYGKTFESIADKADSLVAMGWLHKIFEEYRSRGLHEDALRVQHQLSKKSKDSKNSLKQVIAEVNIPADEFEKILTNLTSDGLNKALLKTAASVLPKINHIKSSIEKLRKEFPLQALMAVTTIADDHIIAKTGSIDTDPDGRLKLEVAQRVSVSTLLLSKTLEKIIELYSPTPEQIINHLYESPLFDIDKKDLILEGVQSYLEGDYVKTIHVLPPQIENILRTFLAKLGQPIIKIKKGIVQLKNINDVLSNKVFIKNVLEDLRLYFLMTLAEPRGLNIRHRVSHGLMSKSEMDKRIADVLINILLCLRLVERVSRPTDKYEDY